MYVLSADPVGVWGSEFDSMWFEIGREVKSKGSEAQAKWSESESKAKSETSRSEAIDGAREFRLGGPKGSPWLHPLDPLRIPLKMVTRTNN